MDFFTITATVLAGLGVALVIFLFFVKKEDTHASESSTEATPTESAVVEPNKKANLNGTKRTTKKKPGNDNKKAVPKTHAYFVAALKGHTGKVSAVCCTDDGKYLATVSEDRTLRLWPIKSLGDKPVPSIRFNVEFDHAVACDFSPDSKACVMALGQEPKLRVYKVDPKKKGSDPFELKQTIPKDGRPLDSKIIACGISTTNPNTRSGCTFIMAATAATDLLYFSLGGEELKRIDTKMVYHTCARLSPDGRYTAIAGFVGGVRIMEVISSGGTFVDVVKATVLPGHNSEVYDCEFTPCSKALCSVSKDGTWQAWDLDVEFNRNADAILLGSGTYTESGDRSFCALAPNKKVVAIGSGSTIEIFSVASGKLLDTIPNAHPGGDLNSIVIDSASKYIASSSGLDRMACVFHNVPGHREALASLQQQLLKPGSVSSKRIVQDQIQDLETLLKDFGSA